MIPAILISFNECREMKDALGSNATETNIPYDFKVFTENGIVAVERKEFPGDFLASVRDGRLAKECAAMREEGVFQVVIKEGKSFFTSDGRLRISGRPSRWTRAGLRNLLRSIRYVEGADIEETDNIEDTAARILEIAKYFEGDHLSLRTRPKLESDWIIPTYQERYIHWLQGIPAGISVGRARMLSGKFKSPPEIFGASIVDIESVSGIGKKTADKIYKFLHNTEEVT